MFGDNFSQMCNIKIIACFINNCCFIKSIIIYRSAILFKFLTFIFAFQFYQPLKIMLHTFLTCMQVLRSFEKTKTERQEIPVVQFPSLNIWDQTVSYLCADAQRMYFIVKLSWQNFLPFILSPQGTLTALYNQFPYYLIIMRVVSTLIH